MISLMSLRSLNFKDRFISALEWFQKKVVLVCRSFQEIDEEKSEWFKKQIFQYIHELQTFQN